MDDTGFMDVLTKLKNVFKTDMYIVDKMYCIGGEESEDKNVGYSLCVLTPEVSEYLSETFGEHTKVIYIVNIAEAKKNYKQEKEYLYIKTTLDPKVKKNVIIRECKNAKNHNLFCILLGLHYLCG